MSGFIDPDRLQQRLADPSVRVLESSVAKETYDEAHIPGALWVDHFADLLRNGDESSGEVLTPAQFAALMSRLGIAPQTTVVWYGDRHSSYATRGYWTMDYYRHPGDIFVLAGGRERWIAERRPVARDVTAVVPAPYPLPLTRDDANRAGWQRVRDAIGNPAAVILDVRSPEEYDGTNRRARRGGHIPGAVNIEWTQAMAGDNVLRSPDALRRLYEHAGVTPDKEVIAHCQLGVRASHTWFVLKHVLGYPDVRNYDGSWQEWGNRDDLPVER
jgi:thiosulfate/3-mercaptopyruvate sulfurtransferase